MTTHVDLYYTMRSPYCYLSTPQLGELVDAFDLRFDLKPVYPLALSDPTFFVRVNPLWPPYLFKDTARIAKRLQIPFRWPNPDPVVQDMATRVVSKEQPYIRRLTYLAQLAAEKELGLEFVSAVGPLLFNAEGKNWLTGTRLADAVGHAGLNLAELDEAAVHEADRIEAAVLGNREAQLSTGHWGAPLFVHAGEIFFGQDRIEDLVWYLQHQGLRQRA